MPNHPELAVGARGGSVRVLQHLLNQALHAKPGLTRDGIFGAMTKSGTTRFQQAHGLAADGIVGVKTWAALGSSLHLPDLAAAAAKPNATPATHPAASASAGGAASAARPSPAPLPHPNAAPTAPHLPPPRASAPPSAPAPAAAPPAPVQGSDASDPAWYQVALAEFEAHKTVFGTADGNQRIHEYFQATSYHPGIGTHEAWCSAFVNWCMKQAGIAGTNLASAASWRDWGVALAKPRHGCVMVIHWAGRTSGSGNHVTFFDSQAGNTTNYFGGNQGKRHQISHARAGAGAFASVHYRWKA
ncbi:TIGR02594 family protein [Polymorphobacter sp. PAMC 29334]|uniref:NlpC/P60 family protein n=1 Tax=Polymorphobacter sp. PAMC 29334 TaxID=2862331 RepID=UPI001C75F24A|nr:TIGR02594 family protein [Polymorphobacter sp. PAMC 29334]QYE34314.1 TIGR02594 family protein [Polymorphobacter sp. PAMC 29334]